MNGVIYARYSSDNQREESIEGQLRECQAFAEKNDITILNTYIDRAFSAKTDNRPEFQHMISDSKKKMFDVVLVWKYDRFARNRLDSLMYKQLLKRNDIKLISVTEPIMNSSVGIIVESMIDSYNEYYSADLAEKVLRGMTENALKCKYNGGYLTLGYYADDEQYIHVDPLYVPVILDIFTMYDEGATIKEIRDHLNEKSVKPKNGKEFTYTMLDRILHNRKYIGEYSFKDVVIPDGIPLARQEKIWLRDGFALSRATMANWIIKVAEKWLKPLYKVMKKQLLSGNVIYADETVVQVLKEEGKTPQSESRMWVYGSDDRSGKALRIFECQPDRSGERCKRFLSSFNGALVTDGYAGYNAVENVT